MNRFALASFLIIAALPATATTQEPTHNVQGAVRVVDVRARTLEVTTGVGMALRVVRLAVPAQLQIVASGVALPLARLQPGDIVRVSYGSRQGAYVAYTIERLERVP